MPTFDAHIQLHPHERLNMEVPQRFKVEREDLVFLLQELLPAYKEGAKKFSVLAAQAASPGWRDVFALFRKELAQAAAELEEKMTEIHMTPKPELEATFLHDEEEDHLDVLSRDKARLLQCLNHQTHVVHLHTTLRLSPLPFDVRTLLQRHQLQAKKMLERLVSIYVMYPPTSRNTKEKLSLLTRLA